MRYKHILTFETTSDVVARLTFFVNSKGSMLVGHNALVERLHLGDGQVVGHKQCWAADL